MWILRSMQCLCERRSAKPALNRRLSRTFFRPASRGLAKSTVAQPEIFFGRRPAANSAAYRTTRDLRSINRRVWSPKNSLNYTMPKSMDENEKKSLHFLLDTITSVSSSFFPFGSESPMELSLSGTKVPGIFRSRKLSFPGANVPLNFRSWERKFHGTFAPGSESSIGGTFAPGSESSWERKFLLPRNS